MNNSDLKLEYIGEQSEAVLIKLNKSVLGGNDALDFTNSINQIVKSEAKCIIVDLENVELMNSTGIGMLANAHSISTKNNLNLLLINIPAKILKLLKMTQLDRVLKIYDNLEEALSYCKLN